MFSLWSVFNNPNVTINLNDWVTMFYSAKTVFIALVLIFSFGLPTIAQAAEQKYFFKVEPIEVNTSDRIASIPIFGKVFEQNLNGELIYIHQRDNSFDIQFLKINKQSKGSRSSIVFNIDTRKFEVDIESKTITNFQSQKKPRIYKLSSLEIQHNDADNKALEGKIDELSNYVETLKNENLKLQKELSEAQEKPICNPQPLSCDDANGESEPSSKKRGIDIQTLSPSNTSGADKKFDG